jgi:hypothetical protein
LFKKEFDRSAGGLVTLLFRVTIAMFIPVPSLADDVKDKDKNVGL